MMRVLLSAVLTTVLLLSGAAPVSAGLENDPKWWKVLTASLCNDKHEYVVMQQDHPGPYFIFDRIRATWDPQTKEALEKAEGGKASFEWKKRTCQADPWSHPAATAGCTYVAGSPSSATHLLPYDLTHSLPPTPSQIPAPTIKAPGSTYDYPVSDPFPIQVLSDWQSSFCKHIRITMTAPKGQFTIPLPYTGVTTWKPQGWAGGPVPEGTWKFTAFLEVYDGKSGFIKGQEAANFIYIGTKPAKLDEKLVVNWPGSPDSSSAPAYNPGQLQGAKVEVKIHKILFDLMSPKRVTLAWKAPWAATAWKLPADFDANPKVMYSPATLWRAAQSGPLDFTGQQNGKWELKACVRTSYAAEVCAAPVYFTVNPLAETGGGSSAAGVGGGLEKLRAPRTASPIPNSGRAREPETVPVHSRTQPPAVTPRGR